MHTHAIAYGHMVNMNRTYWNTIYLILTVIGSRLFPTNNILVTKVWCFIFVQRSPGWNSQMKHFISSRLAPLILDFQWLKFLHHTFGRSYTYGYSFTSVTSSWCSCYSSKPSIRNQRRKKYICTYMCAVQCFLYGWCERDVKWKRKIQSAKSNILHKHTTSAHVMVGGMKKNFWNWINRQV